MLGKGYRLLGPGSFLLWLLSQGVAWLEGTETLGFGHSNSGPEEWNTPWLGLI